MAPPKASPKHTPKPPQPEPPKAAPEAPAPAPTDALVPIPVENPLEKAIESKPEGSIWAPCKVSDPHEVSGSMGRKHTVYNVGSHRAPAMAFQVERRYSDFIWLQDQLKANFAFVIIPPLPGKQVVPSTILRSGSHLPRLPYTISPMRLNQT